MDALQPRIRVVRLRCAPKTYPCPHCGKRWRLGPKTTVALDVQLVAMGPGSES